MRHQSPNIIDPHLHLFNLQAGDYQWLAPQHPPFWPDKQLINRNFMESDLAMAPPHHLAGFVHIEAGFDNSQPWREITWLEQHCTIPFRSVAFADLSHASFTEHLKLLQQKQSVVGIRHILDEQAVEILSLPVTHQHFSLLAELNYSFDAQLPLADSVAVDLLINLAKKYQSVRIIINHGGWPTANSSVGLRGDWLLNMAKLAECENVAIKLSGWEMSDRNWRPDQALKVIQDCLERFGTSRVMLASNFPVCLLAMPYSALWRTYEDLPGLSDLDFRKMTYSNAKNWYKVP